MTLSTEQLLAIARSYWRPDDDSYRRQEWSPEAERLEARWEQELARLDRWHAFLQDLRQELPSFTIGDGTATPDACFRCIAYPVRGNPLPPFPWVVVGCTSILVPHFIIYGLKYQLIGGARHDPRLLFEPLPPEMQVPADLITRRMEETFGVSKLPRELAETPVPLFVEWKKPPHTTLFHALFTNAPENVP
jgi:hypothetical protein